MSLRALPGGDLLIAAQDPWLGRIGPNASSRWTHDRQQMDARGQSRTLGLSLDGMMVDFGYNAAREARGRFDLATLTLSAGASADSLAPAPVQEIPTASAWINSLELGLDPYEPARSFAIHPDGKRFLLGAEWSLRAFDAHGELWRRPVPGTAWAVNISGDGRLALAAYADGTLRWYRMQDGAELLAFFPFSDGKHWVAWTPEGYYASAPGSSDALGWVVNRSWDKAADFISISDVKGYYKPEMIKLVLPLMDTERAFGRAGMRQDERRVQEAVQSAEPPGAQLHVLAIGVSDYANAANLTLDFADDDAKDLATALRTQAGMPYSQVNATTLLNGDATQREVLRALRNLGQAVDGEQGDVVVIHFSGHGAVVDGRYYLLPADVEMDDEAAIEDTAIPIGALRDRLEVLGKSARVVVLLDACHSGSMAEGSKAGALSPDIEVVRSGLVAAGSGVIVLTSSSGRELSVESPDWGHGAFTAAVLEALAGRGNVDGNDWLTVSELEAYVAQRVGELTANQQTPQLEVRGAGYFHADLFYAGG